jgi:hypothetical protein
MQILKFPYHPASNIAFDVFLLEPSCSCKFFYTKFLCSYSCNSNININKYSYLFCVYMFLLVKKEDRNVSEDNSMRLTMFFFQSSKTLHHVSRSSDQQQPTSARCSGIIPATVASEWIIPAATASSPGSRCRHDSWSRTVNRIHDWLRTSLPDYSH